MSRQDIHTPEEWARILKEQAGFTREQRHELYNRVDIKAKKVILDVGCGTGVITADIAGLTDGHVIGIDIDDKKLEYAKEFVSDRMDVMIADVLNLPFRDNTFDVVTFSIVLTHILRQEEALTEMARVTRKGGFVLATTEPDYAGILSYPETEADAIFEKRLEGIGVEMRTGRKLKYLFRKAGLETEIGLCKGLLDYANEDSEKRVERSLKYFHKTKDLLAEHGRTEEKIETFKQEQIELIRNDMNFSFCPCFYAIGKKV